MHDDSNVITAVLFLIVKYSISIMIGNEIVDHASMIFVCFIKFNFIYFPVFCRIILVVVSTLLGFIN